jgi:ABC-type branched-subunit amino acid transport system permease subunit
MLERSPLATIPFDRVGHRRVGEFGTVLAFSLAAFAMVIAGPWILDAYSVNVLTRSLLYACLALTVDLLWGTWAS